MSRISSKAEIAEAKKKEKRVTRLIWKTSTGPINTQIMNLVKTSDLASYIRKQNHRWVAHICRAENISIAKQLMFPDEKTKQVGGRPNSVIENVLKYQNDVKFKSPEECYGRKL